MLYPFTFEPILKKIIWGGSDICPFKGISPVQEGIGESWELSHVEGNYSVVANGELKGQSLDDLIRTYGKQLLGEHVMEQFGTTFPLLIKFIDARDNLSIQVHPDDELAKKRQDGDVVRCEGYTGCSSLLRLLAADRCRRVCETGGKQHHHGCVATLQCA